MALICDTSALLAALDRADPRHADCARLLSEAREDLVVPMLALAELDYFCAKKGLHEAWSGFLEDVEAGAWRVVAPTHADLCRARELQEMYHDLGIGVVDASIAALCERLAEDRLATLDRRHFGTVRLNHVKVLTLLP